MPILVQNRQQIENFFEAALEQYKYNLKLHQDSIVDTKTVLNIQVEMQSNAIWHSIKESMLQYMDIIQDEKELLEQPKEKRPPQTIAALYQAKDDAVTKFAAAITRLIKNCDIKFTDPTKDYLFWGTSAGEVAANKQSDFGRTANIIASASVGLFHILLGPIYIDDQASSIDGEINFVFPPDGEQTSARYALQALLYPDQTRPTPPELPDCSRLLWAAMSKLFAESASEAIVDAKKSGGRSPELCVFLPEQVSVNSNYWLWELPQLSQTGAKITYKGKLGNNWVDTTLQEYQLLIQKDFNTPNDPKITVEKLHKIEQKWKAFAANKDRQRSLSVILNVLQSKPTVIVPGGNAYHLAAQKSEQDTIALNNVSKELDKIWNDDEPYTQHMKNIRVLLLNTYYTVNKTSLPLLNTQVNKDSLAFRFGKNTLDLKKIPSSLGGQLKLMQMAKKFHQYQLIIDLYYQSGLDSLSESVQGKELIIWALNRRAELCWTTTSMRQVAQKDLQRSAAIEKRIETIVRESGSPVSKAALFEKGRRISLLLATNPQANDDESINKVLTIYKDNLFLQDDPASGAKYIQELGLFFNKHSRLPTNITLATLRDIAERTYKSILLTGIEECAEPTLLRAALLAALTVNDPTKIACVKDRIKKVQIDRNELNYTGYMSFCQLTPSSEADGMVKCIKMSANADFIEIYKSQQQEEFKGKTKHPIMNAQEKFLQSSYDYRQSLATYYGGMIRGGNLQYGGALPQQLVTNSDISIFGKLLNEPIAHLIPTQELLDDAIARIPESNLVAKQFFKDARDYFYKAKNAEILRNRPLSSFEDASEVLEIMRYIVAINFQSIADAADPDKASYRQLDYAMSAMTRLMIDGESRKKQHFDSATSISIMYGLQVGDCRHHAESMQLLFDTWKYRRLSTALNEKNTSYFNSLYNKQLRIIDTQEETLDKSTGEKKFTYAHTFNVLQEIDTDNVIQHTVFDAFDLSSDPKIVTMQMDGEALILSIPKIDVSTGAPYDGRYKFTPYAGDKGTAKATGQDLTLIGRSGITEESVYAAIVDPIERKRAQESVAQLAQKEQTRARKEMDLKSLFEMIIIKGYTFDYSNTIKEDAVLSSLLEEYTKDMGYPKSGAKPDATRLLSFYHEIQNRPDLYKVLIDTHSKKEIEIANVHLKHEVENRVKRLFNMLLTSPEFLKTNSSGIKKIQAILNDVNKTMVDKLLVMQQIGKEKITQGFNHWYSHSHFFGKGRSHKVDNLYALFSTIRIDNNDINNPQFSTILDKLELELKDNGKFAGMKIT